MFVSSLILFRFINHRTKEEVSQPESGGVGKWGDFATEKTAQCLVLECYYDNSAARHAASCLFPT